MKTSFKTTINDILNVLATIIIEQPSILVPQTTTDNKREFVPG